MKTCIKKTTYWNGILQAECTSWYPATVKPLKAIVTHDKYKTEHYISKPVAHLGKEEAQFTHGMV